MFQENLNSSIAPFCFQIVIQYHQHIILNKSLQRTITYIPFVEVKTRRNSPKDTLNYEDNIFESLCVLFDITYKYHANKTVALNHHLYDHLSDTWIKKRSKPRLFINFIIKLLPEDHQALGFSLNVTPKAI